jgi:2',3'-cyclic-nucleotide 2'-phosphodiesterase (5'-nucleotidase family)
MQRIFGIIFTLLLAVALPGSGFAAGFGTGNLVVLRAGDGSGALSSAAAAVFLDEYTAAGTKVQSLAMPTVASGSNRPLTVAGSSTADGALRRSADGRFLTLAGYAAAPATAAVAGTTSAGTNRVVGRVDGTGAIDTSTSLSGAYSAGNIRGAVTSDGTAFWTVGSNSGVQYVLLGSSGTSTQINTAAPTNLRVPGIFNGQLYVSSASGTFQGVGTVGSGLQTTGGQTPSLLPGFPTASGPSPYGFYISDANTVYVADDRTTPNGGIQKWTFNGATWTLAKTMGGAGARGVTGYVSGSNVVLFATTTEASANKLVTVTDDGSNSTPAFTTLASAPANTAFRGIDLAPLSPVNGACGTDNGQILAATAPTNLCTAGTASSVSGIGHPWSWSCNGQNGGSTASCSATIQSYALTFATDGNGTLIGATSQTVDFGGSATPVSANANGGYSFLDWTGTSGFVTSYANPLTVSSVTASQTITANFTATPVSGACGSDNGKTLAATAPTNLCATGAASAVTGSGHPWSWSCNGANGGSTAGCSAAIQSYTLTFATDGNGTIDGAASQTVDFGGSATPVSANAKDNYYFLNWTGTNGFTTTTSNPITISNVIASQSFTANFKGGFTIFHVNDTHARVTPHKWIVTEHSSNTTPVFEDVGGAAYLASELLQLTAAQPNSLVLDAGDISEGNPIGDMNGNGAMTQFYTMLSAKLMKQRGRGMDAMVIGNHDVRDATYINNILALQSSGVPVISANLVDVNTQKPYFPPYTTVTINGTKIGILGYTTADSEVGASLSNTLKVVACDWSGTSAPCHLADYVNDLRNNQGCDVVVLLAHVGHSAIVDPVTPLLADNGAAKLPEIAVTGHWHTWSDTVWQPEELNYKTIFTESDSYMKYIGELKVSDTGAYISSYQHIIRDADITPDPDVQALVSNVTAQYNAAHPGHPVDEVIGYTADNLMLDNAMKWWSADEYPWSGNNTAGQWICDAMQWKAAQLFGQCDLSIESGGGVRADIPAGAVTNLQIYETYPWNDDYFTRVNMTGQEIVNYLKVTNMDTGFSSALQVTAYDGVPSNVLLNGQPIDLNHTYTVAISNYMYTNPPSGWTWSDTAPINSPVLCRDGIVDYMRQFTAGNPYHVGGPRYHLNTEFSGGYRAVVTMMNDNDTKPSFDDAFIRFLSATPETLARLGSNQVPTDLVNADGTINAANRLAEEELYRSYLGFKAGALKPGDIIETWGKGSFYGGDPEFVDQEGIYADGTEFKIVGHDDSLAKPAFMSSIGSFWDDWHKNHYVQFLAKKSGTSTVTDQNGQTLSVMDVTAYAAKTLPGNTGDTLLISGVLTMESYGLRFRCDKAVTTTAQMPSVSSVSSHLVPVPPGTTSSTINLSASAFVTNGTYKFAPVADAQVESGYPDSNYGTTNNLYIQSAASGYGNERDWLKFDLSGIPNGATISAASLQLWDWKATGAALPAEVHGGNDDSWTETGITWNSQPAFGATALDTQTLAAGTSNVWYNWDVTSFAHAKLAGNKLVSLVVKPVTEGATDATAPSYAFDAKEYGSNVPVLKVTTQSTGSTVAQVQFFYRYSLDNATWGSWTPIATATTAPYTTGFTFPQGPGYYEFYSQASDSSNNVEPAPAAAQAATRYTDTPAYYPIISIDNVYQRYDGSPKPVTVTTIPASASYTMTYNGDSSVPVAPGIYAVSVTATTGGNTVSASGNLTIAKAAPSDISSRVKVNSSGFVYSRVTKLYTGTLTVTNTSQTTISGTVDVTLANLTAGVTLNNASGAYDADPYISQSVSLNPGASDAIPVQFSNPSNQRINFTPLAYLE